MGKRRRPTTTKTELQNDLRKGRRAPRFGFSSGMAQRKFHGTTLKARELAGFALKEIRPPAGVFIPKHSHANAHVGFILGGGFTETFTRKTLECRPLSVSYIAPDLPHTDDFRYGVHCLVLEIDRERLAQMRDVVGLREPV